MCQPIYQAWHTILDIYPVTAFLYWQKCTGVNLHIDTIIGEEIWLRKKYVIVLEFWIHKMKIFLCYFYRGPMHHCKGLSEFKAQWWNTSAVSSLFHHSFSPLLLIQFILKLGQEFLRNKNELRPALPIMMFVFFWKICLSLTALAMIKLIGSLKYFLNFIFSYQWL